MTSKYDALATYLRQQSGSAHTMTFSDIEDVIGGKLPASARTHRAWWGNSISGNASHVHATHGWQAAGWLVECVSLERESVTFTASFNRSV